MLHSISRSGFLSSRCSGPSYTLRFLASRPFWHLLISLPVCVVWFPMSLVLCNPPLAHTPTPSSSFCPFAYLPARIPSPLPSFARIARHVSVSVLVSSFSFSSSLGIWALSGSLACTASIQLHSIYTRRSRKDELGNEVARERDELAFDGSATTRFTAREDGICITENPPEIHFTLPTLP